MVPSLLQSGNLAGYLYHMHTYVYHVVCLAFMPSTSQVYCDQSNLFDVGV